MRQIILDTETTGLDPARGHRIIEIGCVELVNRRLTGKHYHQYLQPDREVEAGAFEVHGIRDKFLEDKPRFSDVVNEFMAFIKGAELIIHNAPFDVSFINAELSALGVAPGILPPATLAHPCASQAYGKVIDYCSVVDTLAMARQLHPGQKNNLDALCKRYSIDNSQRDLHGALLDAEILADVYLAMTGGQATLLLDGLQERGRGHVTAPVARQLDATRPRLRVIHAQADELALHAQRLTAIDKESGGNCLWKKDDIKLSN